MITSVRFPFTFVGLLIALLAGCKQPANDPPAPIAGPTLVGNWKITAITFSPAWTPFTGATPIPDYIPHLAAKGQTCLTDLTVSFTAAGTYSTNSDNLLTCGNVPDSKIILNYLFVDGASFTENDTSAILYGKNKATSIPVVKSSTNQQLSIRFVSDEDLSSNKIRTTYSVKLARQ